MKPALFITASSHGTELALAIQHSLDDVADVTLSTQGVARLAVSVLETFLEALDASDCAVLVFSPEEAVSDLRDTLFQLGMMVGRIGRERTFIVVPQHGAAALVPTPLLGMTLAEYDVARARQNPHAAVGPATQSIREALKRLEARAQETVLQLFPPTFDSRLETARTLYFWGMNQSDFLIQHYDLLARRLEDGATLRVLLVEPAGRAVELARLRFAGALDVEHEKSRARISLTRLCALQAQYPDRVEIRVLDYVFSYGAFLIDAESPSAVIYVKHYTFRVAGGSRKPKHVYEKRRTKWFDLTCSEGEQLWRAGTKWTCE